MTDLDPLEEAMRQPLEGSLTKWRREADEQEARFAEARAKRARSADLRISAAIADERQFMIEVLAETIIELTERQRETIDAALQPLRIELAELKVANADLRVKLAEQQLAASHATTIDLPPIPLRGSRAN